MSFNKSPLMFMNFCFNNNSIKSIGNFSTGTAEANFFKHYTVIATKPHLALCRAFVHWPSSAPTACLVHFSEQSTAFLSISTSRWRLWMHLCNFIHEKQARREKGMKWGSWSMAQSRSSAHKWGRVNNDICVIHSFLLLLVVFLPHPYTQQQRQQ